MVDIIDESQSIQINVETAMILTDGFEAADDPSYSFAKWDEIDIGMAGAALNYVGYSTLHPHSGLNCYQSIAYAGNTGNNAWSNINKSISGTNPIHARFYVLLDQLPPSTLDVRFADVAQYGARDASVYWCIQNNNGTPRFMMRVYNNNVWVNVFGSNCEINKMYCIEIEYYHSTTGQGYATLYVDGTKVCELTNVTATRFLNSFSLGHCFSNANATNDTSLYFDDVIINNVPIGCL